MALVLDASATLAWFFDDEAPLLTAEMRSRLIREPVHVPALWITELGQGIVNAERRKRVVGGSVAALNLFLAGWNIVIDPPDLDRLAARIVPLAVEHALTAYNAAYLELATRMRLPLATRDGPLATAALRVGLKQIQVS